MSRVLLVGPERDRAVGIRSLLARAGHTVVWARTEQAWRSLEREQAPDVVVAAVAHPEGVLGKAGTRPARGFPAPILFVQQEADFLHDLAAEERIVDQITSPFLSEELLARVDALARVRQQVLAHAPSAAAMARPAAKTAHAATTFGQRLGAWLRTRLPREELPTGPYLEVAACVAEWADRRDAFAPGHAERVTSFCGMIAEGLDMDERETSQLLRAAMLHDIGKVALPVEVLWQSRPLEESQLRLIRTHPARGAAILRALDPDDGVAKVVLYHHEHPDGTGYYRAPASTVPRAAHALAVAEVYDAMTSSRLRPPLSSVEALDRLQAEKGRDFDGPCVEALADVLRPRASALPISSSLA